MRAPSGIVLVAAATGLVGIAGYVITWLVPRSIGFEEYATFAVFWAFVFLVVAALSGVQQEVTRATSISPTPAPVSSGVWRFAALLALAVFVAVAASATLWVDSVFPGTGWSLVWPLAVGVASYVFVAVITGLLYGAVDWNGVFWIVVFEGLLRLVTIVTALLAYPELVALAWAVALPFSSAVLLMLPTVRRRLIGRVVLDVAPKRLAWNSARTMVAATSMGLLISGFPLVLGVTAQSEPPALLALVILVTTLVRAPLIVTAMALQSYLIIFFKTRTASFWRAFLSIEVLVLGVGAVLALAGYLLGPAVFGFLFPGEPVPESWFVAALVISSALVGALCVSAPAVLSKGHHGFYATGWVVAAVGTVVALMLPIDLITRTVIAVTLAPVAGVLVHAGCLVFGRARRAEPEPQVPSAPQAEGI